MHKHTVLVADDLHQSGWQALREANDIFNVGPFSSRAEVLEAASTTNAVIIRSTTQVDREFLQSAPDLQIIARAGSRLDNVDIEGATRLGILVMNVPSANVVAIAEHTFALLLALARKIPQGYNALRSGGSPESDLLGFEISRKTLGVIGFGRIGREVASRAQAFGMPVLAYDPNIDLDFARRKGVEAVNFAELLARADIMSLHTALTPETQNIIDEYALKQMKPDAYLVNCADSHLIDEDALLEALNRGDLAGAALDSFRQGHDPPNPALVNHPQVLCTPNLNQHTVETETTTSTQIVQDVLAALRDQDFRHIVNLPFSETTTYQSVKPYLHLASKLGKLQGQLAEGKITRVEVEVFGAGLGNLVRPVAAVLLSGMLQSTDNRRVNWVSAPVLAHEFAISMAQAKGLVQLEDYPAVIACRIYWQTTNPDQKSKHRTVAGVLFGNGEARLLQYDHFQVDAKPEGYVVVLENIDVPGVIGKVGTRFGQQGINIGQWRYGRRGNQAVSFINLDGRPPEELLRELEGEPEISSARLVHL
jgi:D-3-phosphoglycerate dehydrogenase